MAKLYNIARMTTATTGTGTITLGAAVSGYLSFSGAGISNSDIVSYAIKDGTNSEIGTGTYTSAGTTLTRNVIKSTNSNTAISLSGTAEVFITPRAEDYSPADPGFLFGLTLSTAGSSATFSVAAGRASDSAAVEMMVLASSLSKTTSAWAVGSGNGGLDTGAIANNTWYHAYLIKRADTNVVDVLVSLSGSSPTLPTNYTWFRRIGAMKTNGAAQWTKFNQVGDLCFWDAPVADVGSANPGTTATNYTLSVPTGINVEAIFNSAFTNTVSTAQALWFSPVGSAQAANTPGGNYQLFVAANVVTASQVRILTNTSAQVSAVCSTPANNLLFAVTAGWADRRGRDA